MLSSERDRKEGPRPFVLRDRLVALVEIVVTLAQRVSNASLDDGCLGKSAGDARLGVVDRLAHSHLAAQAPVLAGRARRREDLVTEKVDDRK